MSGLFVRKHVEAVCAQGVEVRVIFSQGWQDTWRQWRALRREGWMPDVVQLNVLQKQGFLALYLKKHYGIPYVIVEHWSGYLPENGAYLRNNGSLKRKIYEKIAAEASVIMPVSERLKEAMQTCGIQNARWEKIHNVVDDFFFEKPELRNDVITESRDGRKTLLHVSCFDEAAKNVKGLLRAAKTLSEKRQDWQLALVGTGTDYKEVRAYANTLAFPEGTLRWTGELTPREVAKEMHKADAFVLPSNYENAPVVLSESLAMGLPIIASRVGGIPEMVDDESGILVPTRDEKALAEAMDEMLDNLDKYDSEKIRLQGEQYSFETVGKHFKAVYESVL